MEFNEEPFEPLQLGVPPEYYDGVLKEYEYDRESIWPRLSGEVEVDGKYRFTKFSVRDDIVVGIEICEIGREDTFCGVPMRERPKKFQKLLAAAGLDSRIEYSGINLVEYPVGFFIEGGRIASINWERDIR